MLLELQQHLQQQQSFTEWGHRRYSETQHGLTSISSTWHSLQKKAEKESEQHHTWPSSFYCLLMRCCCCCCRWRLLARQHKPLCSACSATAAISLTNCASEASIDPLRTSPCRQRRNVSSCCAHHANIMNIWQRCAGRYASAAAAADPPAVEAMSHGPCLTYFLHYDWLYLRTTPFSEIILLGLSYEKS